MMQEQAIMAKHQHEDYEVPLKIFKELIPMYKLEYKEGPWLTQQQKVMLSTYGKGRL